MNKPEPIRLIHSNSMNQQQEQNNLNLLNQT